MRMIFCRPRPPVSLFVSPPTLASQENAKHHTLLLTGWDESFLKVQHSYPPYSSALSRSLVCPLRPDRSALSRAMVSSSVRPSVRPSTMLYGACRTCLGFGCHATKRNSIPQAELLCLYRSLRATVWGGWVVKVTPPTGDRFPLPSPRFTAVLFSFRADLIFRP